MNRKVTREDYEQRVHRVPRSEEHLTGSQAHQLTAFSEPLELGSRRLAEQVVTAEES
jgi:hypothetical protein